MYLLTDAGKAKKGAPRVQLLGSGTILREVIAAAALLEKDFGVLSDIWSCPSFIELRRDGVDAERWNRLNPEAKSARKAWITQCLEDRGSTVAVAATDYVRAFSEQVRAYLPKGMQYTALGTDGFGRSDTRDNLRRFFEVDRYHIAHATVAALAEEGQLMKAHVSKAIQLYGIDPEKPNPATV
jgi:pyruvate dehydrogenase E1 component